MVATQILKTRVTPGTKARVLEITQAELLTEAVWLRRLVARALHPQGFAASTPEVTERHSGPLMAPRGQCSKNRGRAARLYVRLRREDHLLLHERAAARGMASATYVSVLVRGHLRSLAPLPQDELVALKQAVSALGAMGRNLKQIARTANQAALLGGVGAGRMR